MEGRRFGSISRNERRRAATARRAGATRFGRSQSTPVATDVAERTRCAVENQPTAGRQNRMGGARHFNGPTDPRIRGRPRQDPRKTVERGDTNCVRIGQAAARRENGRPIEQRLNATPRQWKRTEWPGPRAASISLLRNGPQRKRLIGQAASWADSASSAVIDRTDNLYPSYIAMP